LRCRPLGTWAGLLAALAFVPSSRAYLRAFHDDVSMNREVVRRQPASFQGRRNLAIALLRSGQYREAIAQAEETIARYPVSDPYWVLINAYLALGDGPRAASALETFLRLRPDIPPPALEPQRRQAERLRASPPGTGAR
jgi:tetratricopeptide (TPR) repeat protein